MHSANPGNRWCLLPLFAQAAGGGSGDEDWAFPAILMFAGLAVWIGLIIWQAFVARRRGSSPSIERALCLTAGGLVLVSGFT